MKPRLRAVPLTAYADLESMLLAVVVFKFIEMYHPNGLTLAEVHFLYWK